MRISRTAGVIGAVLILAIAAAALAVLFSPAIQLRIFDRAAVAMTARSNRGLLADDALRVAICGSSAPLPSARRAKACVAVFAGGKFYLVDVGPESVENLLLWGVPMASIGGVGRAGPVAAALNASRLSCHIASVNASGGSGLAK